MKIGKKTDEGVRFDEYTFERNGDKKLVTITGPDVGDYHEYRETISLPVETLVKYLVKTGRVVKKTVEKRKR
jgi:hypothetical protein